MSILGGMLAGGGAALEKASHTAQVQFGDYAIKEALQKSEQEFQKSMEGMKSANRVREHGEMGAFDTSQAGPRALATGRAAETVAEEAAPSRLKRELEKTDAVNAANLAFNTKSENVTAIAGANALAAKLANESAAKLATEVVNSPHYKDVLKQLRDKTAAEHPDRIASAAASAVEKEAKTYKLEQDKAIGKARDDLAKATTPEERFKARQVLEARDWSAANTTSKMVAASALHTATQKELSAMMTVAADITKAETPEGKEAAASISGLRASLALYRKAYEEENNLAREKPKAPTDTYDTVRKELRIGDRVIKDVPNEKAAREILAREKNAAAVDPTKVPAAPARANTENRGSILSGPSAAEFDVMLADAKSKGETGTRYLQEKLASGGLSVGQRIRAQEALK